MEVADQVKLIQAFMLRISPEVARHKLSAIARAHAAMPLDEDHLGQMYRSVAVETARMSLEFSMHLAAQYSGCYDTMLRETHPSKTQDTAQTQQ